MTAWQTATPEAVGMNGETLAGVGGWLDGLAGANIHSVVVARNGALVFEHYRRGDDERWRTSLSDVAHGATVKHDIRSVTKVVVRLLLGDALARGLIPDLDVPVFDFFPDYADLRTPAKERISLRHLAIMAAGLEWDENLPVSDPAHGEMRMWRSDDRLRTALEPPLVAEPGTRWAYSGGCTELLGAVLQRVSGQPIDAYARDVLFAPLAITDVEWGRHADGGPSASGGLRMRAPDLAKIGQVAVDGGHWNGTQVLPASWLAQALTPQIGADDRLFFYGHHWWLGRSLVRGRDVTWAAGIGLGGQRLFVVPDLALVVAVTAGHYTDGMQAWLPSVILNRFVLRAVT